MCSRFLRLRPHAAAALLALLVLVPALAPAQAPAPAPVRQLRVCADPNNLPFSNQAGQGFENKIAAILATELKAQLHTTWWAQRRGFVRNTLKAGKCDLMISAPHQFELASTTAPYYRSSYMFVYRKDRNVRISSLDDPQLRTLTIGVHLVGDDYTNTPPAHALARRKIIDNVVGFTLYGDYRLPDPPLDILDALVAGTIDVAIVWGPLAGFFARHTPQRLELVNVSPRQEQVFLPMAFDISMAVRHGEPAFKAEIEAAIARRRTEIDLILEQYGVPRLPLPGTPGTARARQ